MRDAAAAYLAGLKSTKGVINVSNNTLEDCLNPLRPIN
jgi:hypothetical protein